jgi:hypothetical protein
VAVAGKTPVPRAQITRQNLDAMLACPYTSAVPWMDVFLDPWRRPLLRGREPGWKRIWCDVAAL